MKRYGRPRRKSRNNSGNWRSRKNVRFLNKILRDVYEFFYWKQSEKNKLPPEVKTEDFYLKWIAAQNLPDE